VLPAGRNHRGLIYGQDRHAYASVGMMALRDMAIPIVLTMFLACCWPDVACGRVWRSHKRMARKGGSTGRADSETEKQHKSQDQLDELRRPSLLKLAANLRPIRVPHHADASVAGQIEVDTTTLAFCGHCARSRTLTAFSIT